MLDQTDSRQFVRMDEPGEISYKFPDAEQSYIGVCLNISGSGILFKTKRFIDRGSALEVTFARQNALTLSMIAYVEVVRSKEVGSNAYEVAIEIKGIKES